MRHITSILLFAFLIATALGCGETKGTLVKGTIENAGGLQVALERTALNNQKTAMGKTEAGSNGSFEISVPEGLQAGLYQLTVGAKTMYLPLGESTKKIEIKGDLATLDKYQAEVVGSPVAEEYVNAMGQLFDKSLDMQGAQQIIKETEHPYLATKLLFDITQGRINEQNLELYKTVSNKLAGAYPGTSDAQTFGQFIANAEQQIAAQKQQAQTRSSGPIAVGQPAPDIALEDPYGKVRRLSDLKGKVVLLDFWASWCGPCRRANPHVVETYKKYKDQGFTVFSVSLDGINPRRMAQFAGNEEAKQQELERQKNRWIQAIEKDGLLWDYHVSDLQHWNSPAAKQYGVRSIPRTFLVDREGNIAVVGVNPLRDPIDNLIEELL